MLRGGGGGVGGGGGGGGGLYLPVMSAYGPSYKRGNLASGALFGTVMKLGNRYHAPVFHHFHFTRLSRVEVHS